jgi:hypothetical protein
VNPSARKARRKELVGDIEEAAPDYILVYVPAHPLERLNAARIVVADDLAPSPAPCRAKIANEFGAFARRAKAAYLFFELRRI